MNDALKINDDELQELLSEINDLTTYDEVRVWGERAQNELERLKSILRGLDVEIARDSQSLESLRYEASKKMFGKLLGAGKEEKELSRRLDEYKTSKAGLSQTIIQLQDYLDFTPINAEERESLLTELRLRKKVLQEKKREITQVVRKPRMVNPQAEPEDATFSPAVRARRKARYDREDVLLPGETTSASLARQIAGVERDIQRIEKLGE